MTAVSNFFDQIKEKMTADAGLYDQIKEKISPSIDVGGYRLVLQSFEQFALDARAIFLVESTGARLTAAFSSQLSVEENMTEFLALAREVIAMEHTPPGGSIEKLLHTHRFDMEIK